MAKKQEDALVDLFDAFAGKLAELLESEEDISPSLMSVIRQFLKDNEINIDLLDARDNAPESGAGKLGRITHPFPSADGDEEDMEAFG